MRCGGGPIRIDANRTRGEWFWCARRIGARLQLLTGVGCDVLQSLEDEAKVAVCFERCVVRGIIDDGADDVFMSGRKAITDIGGVLKKQVAWG
eukprot:917984-Prymnesium_polylepis.3